jgi:hypothetical protein
MTPLVAILGKYQTRLPKLASQISNAMHWVSQARRATTASERFLAPWIAAEFLTLSGRSNASKNEDRGGLVASRLAGLLGRSSRTNRRAWQTTMKKCYELRNLLVHEARDEPEELDQYAPRLMQAITDAVLYCVLTMPSLEMDLPPSELLDRHRFKKDSAAIATANRET